MLTKFKKNKCTCKGSLNIIGQIEVKWGQVKNLPDSEWSEGKPEFPGWTRWPASGLGDWTISFTARANNVANICPKNSFRADLDLEWKKTPSVTNGNMTEIIETWHSNFPTMSPSWYSIAQILLCFHISVWKVKVHLGSFFKSLIGSDLGLYKSGQIRSLHVSSTMTHKLWIISRLVSHPQNVLSDSINWNYHS